MKLKATNLRKNLYKHLDMVLETGIPIEIERKGHILKIIPDETKSKLSNLSPHNIIVGKPEDLIHTNWINEWDNGKNL